MIRLRILSVLAAVSLLVTLPSAVAAAAPAPDTARVAGGDAVIGSVAQSDDQPSSRLTPRQLRRALPRTRSFGQGTTRRFDRGDFITLCGGDLAGPAPVAATGARYTRANLLSFMGIEEHRSAQAARQRFNAAKRQIRQDCDGRVIGTVRQDRKRAQPVRRIGQQNWHRGYALRLVSDGEVIGEYLTHVYRIGRFVVFADIIGGSNIDPTVDRRPLQRPFRQLGSGVRRL